MSNTIWGALEKYKLQIHESCGGVVDEADFIAGYRAALTQQPESEPRNILLKLYPELAREFEALGWIPPGFDPQPSAQVPEGLWEILDGIEAMGDVMDSPVGADFKDKAIQAKKLLTSAPSIAPQAAQVPTPCAACKKPVEDNSCQLCERCGEDMLRATTTLPEGLHPSVLAFAYAMQEKLDANKYKDGEGWPRNTDGSRNGWLGCGIAFLRGKLEEEFGELVRETYAPINNERLRREAADVGNIAMMLADVSGALTAAPSIASAEE